ncbi:MAG: DEAD/DEAH box helicase, partial [Candidatus Thorarchaeota archaeon]
MKTLDSTLVRVLQALGIKQLNEVQQLAARKGLFNKRGDFALLSMSRTGKSFAGGLFVANEMYKYITSQKESEAEAVDGLSIIIAPFHASARGAAHMISQYYGWFLRPVVAIGDIRSTGLVLKLGKGYNPNVIVATPEALQDLLHTPESRDWIQRHRVVAVVVDDIHSILHDPSRGLSLLEISSYFKSNVDPKPRRLILSAKI